MIPPSDIITKTGETRVIDGLTYEFLYAPNSEASTETMIYIKEKGALNAAEDATQRVSAKQEERMMRKLSHLYTPFVLAGLLCLGVAPAAIGCGFHSPLDVRLESMYPGSFPVAVALRSAADRGVIDAAALEAPSKGTALYADTERRLQEFRKTLAVSPAAAELPANFSLGYVESRLWTRFSQSDGNIRVDIHTDGPAKGEAVVLTGEPVLTAVLAGRLSVDRALAEGMILIDGSESEKAAIRHALIATSTANRISGR